MEDKLYLCDGDIKTFDEIYDEGINDDILFESYLDEYYNSSKLFYMIKENNKENFISEIYDNYANYVTEYINDLIRIGEIEEYEGKDDVDEG